jgi:peptidoglycan hydrolase CwlO-like protein
MTDNELLLALSGMLDKKLKAELQPIKNELQTMKDDIADMKGEIADMKGEIADIRNEIAGMKGEIADIRNEIAGMKGEIASIKSNMLIMQNEIRQIKLCQENIILPRLDTIESCYSDTFNRYRTYADKMDSVFEDVELLKTVVTHHSEKLQKLA